MKKILSGVLCLAMMLSIGVTAFASEVVPIVDPNEITNDGGSQNVTVTYGMSEGFTVTIPTNFTIDGSKKATANVSASDVIIAHGKVLEVAISGDDYVDSWELVDEAEATNTLTYTIGTTEGGNDIVDNSVVLSVGAGEAYGSTVTETMYFTVIDELSKSGEYSDTLTFTVSVEDKVEMATITILYKNDGKGRGYGASVSIDGIEYSSNATIEVPVGTVIECNASREYYYCPAYVYVNGESICNYTPCSYTVTGDVTIQLTTSMYTYDYNNYEYGFIEITEE